ASLKTAETSSTVSGKTTHCGNCFNAAVPSNPYGIKSSFSRSTLSGPRSEVRRSARVVAVFTRSAFPIQNRKSKPKMHRGTAARLLFAQLNHHPQKPLPVFLVHRNRIPHRHRFRHPIGLPRKFIFR